MSLRPPFFMPLPLFFAIMLSSLGALERLDLPSKIKISRYLICRSRGTLSLRTSRKEPTTASPRKLKELNRQFRLLALDSKVREHLTQGTVRSISCNTPTIHRTTIWKRRPIHIEILVLCTEQITKLIERSPISVRCRHLQLH